MPIYAYRCAACGFEQDSLQKMSDAPLTTCPSCGAEALKKQVTAAGFQLKGSGWYATDFRNSGAQPKPAGEGDAPAKPAEGATPATGDAAKPAADASAAPAPAKTEAPAKSAPAPAASSAPPAPAPPTSGKSGR